MPDVIVIGDGPGGLSAALFLAKNGKDVLVFGEDKTAMNYALLKNYLGLPEMLGKDFQQVAREQAKKVGAKLVEGHIQTLEKRGAGFVVTTTAGEKHEARYLVLSEGKAPRLAKQVGLTFDEFKGIETDKNALSTVPNVYVIGRSARPGRSQAIISAGDGAAAAIDILSRDKGEDVTDWDEA